MMSFTLYDAFDEDQYMTDVCEEDVNPFNQAHVIVRGGQLMRFDNHSESMYEYTQARLNFIRSEYRKSRQRPFDIKLSPGDILTYDDVYRLFDEDLDLMCSNADRALEHYEYDMVSASKIIKFLRGGRRIHRISYDIDHDDVIYMINNNIKFVFTNVAYPECLRSCINVALNIPYFCPISEFGSQHSFLIIVLIFLKARFRTVRTFTNREECEFLKIGDHELMLSIREGDKRLVKDLNSKLDCSEILSRIKEDCDARYRDDNEDLCYDNDCTDDLGDDELGFDIQLCIVAVHRGSVFDHEFIPLLKKLI
jgi:hypothetical protein